MKNYNEAHVSGFINGINRLTGIPENKLKRYAAENNLFNVLEHPNTIGSNKQQLEKIHILNEFISAYRLLKLQENENRVHINTSSKAGEYFMALLGGTKDREKFIAAFLDSSNHIIETRLISEGTVGEAAVFPREVLKAALDCDCKSVLFAHNHPGGTQSPSPQDVELTQKLVSIFTPLNIGVLDHIIVAGTQYHSMMEKGTMPQATSNICYDAVPLDSPMAAEEDEADYQAGMTDYGEIDLDDFDFPEPDDQEDEWER